MVVFNSISQVVCPLCSAIKGELYLELPDRLKPGRELYHLYSCPDCDFIFLHPQPEKNSSAGDYVPTKYDPFLEIEEAQSFTQRIYSWVKPWSLKWKLRLIRKFHPQKGSILDVGAGTGAFLAVMKSAGWSTKGVEKEEIPARWGREKLGLDMVCGDLADLSPGENSYDIITFWHSLEHMIRFRENLLQAHKSLTTSGYLFIAVPNPASFEVKIYKRNWVAYDAPRHLWHFRPLVMQRILRVYGFKVIKTIAMPLDPFYNCLLSEGLEKRRGIKLFRYFVRFPMVVGLSFFLGLVNPQKGSSVIYVCNRHQASDLRP